MKKLILSSLLIGSFSFAQAGELLFDTFSYHSKGHYETSVPNGKQEWVNSTTLGPIMVNKSVAYNNFNPGIGYKFDNGVLFGYYDNSYHKPTFYLGDEYMFSDSWGAIVGLATGYQEAVGRNVTIIGGFEYKYRLTEKISANILFLPPISNNTGIVHLMLSYKLN